jgi:hypothetical protein
MGSRRAFIPGSTLNTKRLLKYDAYNQLNNIETNYPYECLCKPLIYNKNVIGSDNPSIRVSYNTRISQIINYYKGGKTQFGNFYLGQPLQLNYLGRAEGMPGGSGTPPKNKFN